MKFKISKLLKLSALLLPLLSLNSCSDSKGNLLFDADPYVAYTSPALFTEIALPQKIKFYYYSDGMNSGSTGWMLRSGLPNGDIAGLFGPAPVSVDPSSECKPKLTHFTFTLGNQTTNASEIYELTGTCKNGDKLVLRAELDRTIAWHVGVPDAPHCKVQYDGCISTNNAEGSKQLLQYTIGSRSDACKAINDIGDISVSNPGTNFSVKSVGTLAADEKITATYTRTSSTSGDQIILRWLDAAQADSTLIANSTVTGTSTASTQLTGDTYLRAYVVGGSWTVRFSCDY